MSSSSFSLADSIAFSKSGSFSYNLLMMSSWIRALMNSECIKTRYSLVLLPFFWQISFTIIVQTIAIWSMITFDYSDTAFSPRTSIRSWIPRHYHARLYFLVHDLNNSSSFHSEFWLILSDPLWHIALIQEILLAVSSQRYLRVFSTFIIHQIKSCNYDKEKKRGKICNIWYHQDK